MADEMLSIEQILSRLKESPERIGALVEGLTAEQLRTPPAPGEWSANDVLAHLRACADVWGGCIARILAEDQPSFRAISPRTAIKKMDYPDLAFRPSWEAFRAQRADLLAVLEVLPLESWERSARVKVVGKVREQSVYYYAERLARHERSHIRQFRDIAEMLRG